MNEKQYKTLAILCKRSSVDVRFHVIQWSHRIHKMTRLCHRVSDRTACTLTLLLCNCWVSLNCRDPFCSEFLCRLLLSSVFFNTLLFRGLRQEKKSGNIINPSQTITGSISGEITVTQQTEQYESDQIYSSSVCLSD